jgi:hypothetical protein
VLRGNLLCYNAFRLWAAIRGAARRKQYSLQPAPRDEALAAAADILSILRSPPRLKLCMRGPTVSRKLRRGIGYGASAFLLGFAFGNDGRC